MSLIAENILVTGKITDLEGNPILNATVTIQNSNPLKGVVTDINGNYKIFVPPFSILEFSHVGTLQKISKNIGLETNYDVSMMNEIALNEIYVYGKITNYNWFLWVLAGAASFKLINSLNKNKIKKITI